ncbi:MAG: phytanoyl-CoA dioxygenase family protein [Alphaproteobacteria bacterium]|nr:phytanoyl-CoA dioxygenase family protein [Alphaproteobacteria bacterium]|tara:strand:- start:1329 stop:2321 length:993 start_codon:yes stop_codon:yes gene_type:complete
MLKGVNALDHGIDQSWQQDNQAWWDWYVTLADNTDQCDDESLVELPPIPHFNVGLEHSIEDELSKPYTVTNSQRLDFRKNGFIKLPNVLSGGAVARLRQDLLQLLEQSFRPKTNINDNNRFLSLEMMWLQNTLLKSYVLSPRIAKISADLLGVESVRLYHDNALAKEPGCGRTPWHCDDDHFPLATQDVVTAWIPAQPIPSAMGPLAFAKPLSVFELVKDIDFNKFDTSYDKQIAAVFKSNNVTIDDSPFALGEVSFHHNRSFHTAGKNKTTRTRVVLANTFFADGARVVDQPTMVSGDWQKFIPGVGPGEVAASKLNPICWPQNNERGV